MNKSLKRLVRERAGGRCEYCGCPDTHSPAPFSGEHILPKSKGGTDELANLCWSCQGCNNIKFTATTAIDHLTGATVPLFNPRRDRWGEHFFWDFEEIRVIGQTPIGRATVSKLHLNRPELLNLRKALLAVGLHPPR